MDILDIIALEGIVIRKIPFQTKSLYLYREGMQLKENQTIIQSGNRQMVEEIKTNALGGKYLITFERGTGSTVIFNLKYNGIGETIELAYADYIKKNGA